MAARAWLQRLVPLAGLLVLLAVIALLCSTASVFLERRAMLGFIDLAAVVGLYIFVGNSGVLSFGHVSFMAVGAYTSALLTMRPGMKAMLVPGLPALIAHAQLSPPLGFVIGALVAAVVALAVGLILMRLSGMAASIATFALLIIAYVGLGNWDSVTGGQKSLMGVPIYSSLRVAFVVAAISVVIAFAYQETRSALVLRAAREDEVAAAATGVNIYLHRLIAFVLSGFVSGLAGALMAHVLGDVRIETFYLDLTFMTIAMLVIGGSGSLTGAVAGTIVTVAATEFLRTLEAGLPLGSTGFVIKAPDGLADSLLALAMLLALIFFPKGISGGRELAWPVRQPRAR